MIRAHNDPEGLNHGSAFRLNWSLSTRKRPYYMLRMSFVAHDPTRKSGPTLIAPLKELVRHHTAGFDRGPRIRGQKFDQRLGSFRLFSICAHRGSDL